MSSSSPLFTEEHARKTIGWSLLGYCLAAPFSISLSQIFLYFAIGAWIFGCKPFSEPSRAIFPLWPLFSLFAATCLLSAIAAPYPVVALKGSKILLNLFIFYLVVNQLNGTRDVEKCLRFLLFASFLASLLGIWQALSGGLGIYNRAHGTFSIYMTYAGFLMLVFTTTLSWKLFDKIEKEKIGWFFLIALFVAILFSLTRNVWVGVAVSVVSIAGLRYGLKGVLIPLILGAALLLFPGEVQKRALSITDLNDTTNNERIVLWKNGWKMIEDYPILGVGRDNFQYLYDNYRKPEDKSLGNMHNIFLTILAEGGIVGLFSWLALLGGIALRYVALLKEPLEKNQRGIVTGVMASMAALLTAGMFESNFNNTVVNMLFFFLLALPFVIEKERATKKETLN